VLWIAAGQELSSTAGGSGKLVLARRDEIAYSVRARR
jgi:hypothetical protein